MATPPCSSPSLIPSNVADYPPHLSHALTSVEWQPQHAVHLLLDYSARMGSKTVRLTRKAVGRTRLASTWSPQKDGTAADASRFMLIHSNPREAVVEAIVPGSVVHVFPDIEAYLRQGISPAASLFIVGSETSSILQSSSTCAQLEPLSRASFLLLVHRDSSKGCSILQVPSFTRVSVQRTAPRMLVGSDEHHRAARNRLVAWLIARPWRAPITARHDASVNDVSLEDAIAVFPSLGVRNLGRTLFMNLGQLFPLREFIWFCVFEDIVIPRVGMPTVRLEGNRGSFPLHLGTLITTRELSELATCDQLAWIAKQVFDGQLDVATDALRNVHRQLNASTTPPALQPYVCRIIWGMLKRLASCRMAGIVGHKGSRCGPAHLFDLHHQQLIVYGMLTDSMSDELLFSLKVLTKGLRGNVKNAIGALHRAIRQAFERQHFSAMGGQIKPLATEIFPATIDEEEAAFASELFRSTLAHHGDDVDTPAADDATAPRLTPPVQLPRRVTMVNKDTGHWEVFEDVHRVLEVWNVYSARVETERTPTCSYCATKGHKIDHCVLLLSRISSLTTIPWCSTEVEIPKVSGAQNSDDDTVVYTSTRALKIQNHEKTDQDALRRVSEVAHNRRKGKTSVEIWEDILSKVIPKEDKAVREHLGKNAPGCGNTEELKSMIQSAWKKYNRGDVTMVLQNFSNAVAAAQSDIDAISDRKRLRDHDEVEPRRRKDKAQSSRPGVAVAARPVVEPPEFSDFDVPVQDELAPHITVQTSSDGGLCAHCKQYVSELSIHVQSCYTN